MSALPKGMGRLAQALGFKTEDGTLMCSGRKGYLYGPRPGNSGGERVPVSTTPDGKPLLMDCEHEALVVLVSLFEKMALLELVAMTVTGKPSGLMPRPEDFQYVFQEDAQEPEVTSLEEAGSVLDSIRRKS